MRGRAVEVVPGEAEREFLEAHVRKYGAPSDRCRIILPCAEGLRSREIAGRTGVHEHMVGKWRRRFAEKRIPGLPDECRSGRPRSVTDDKVAEVVERTPDTMPEDATHRPVRSMAGKTGVSHTTVHRSGTSRPSTDPLFVDRVQDIAGLCLAPPDRKGGQTAELPRRHMQPVRPGRGSAPRSRCRYSTRERLSAASLPPRPACNS